VAALAFGAGTAYRLLASGSLTLDLGVGRRLQPLGPLVQTIAASAEIAFDVVAGPYLGRTPRALSEKLQVWERGSDMALAAHFTQVKCSRPSASSAPTGSTSASSAARCRISSSRSC
jgi:hypothetical protein